jgi:hypothetical protein
MMGRMSLNFMSYAARQQEQNKMDVQLTYTTQNLTEKDKLRCSHCNGSRHTRDTCFEIHGYPEWFLKKQKQSKARNNKRPCQAKLANTVEIPSSVAAMPTCQRDHIKPGEILS